MSKFAVSAKRVGPPWRSEWWPACIKGHRQLMEHMLTQDRYKCSECGWELSGKDWYEYLASHRWVSSMSE